jgi:hypothetical protein
MARDISIRLHRCQYCSRPGFHTWDVDLFTCGSELCQSLAFAEVRRRHRHGEWAAPPEKRLARALLSAYDTEDYALRRDTGAELLDESEARRLRERERTETALLLSELRELARRYPAPKAEPRPARRRRSNPRYRRFVAPGRSAPLRRDRTAA